jgi:hypothetical protein
VLDGTSSTGVLEVLHGVSIYPGVPGQARDRMKIFASLGDVEGVDVATVAYNSKQLSITPDVLVPGSIDRNLQLLAEVMSFICASVVNHDITKVMGQ